MFRELCGDTTLKNIVLVTNMWGMVSPEVGEARENELFSSSFKPALDQGARMIRYHNTTQSAHDIIRVIMVNHPVVSQIQRGLVSEYKGIIDTTAGEAVDLGFSGRTGRHRDEFERVQEHVIRVLKEKNEETRKVPEEEMKRLQEWMEKIKKDSEGLEAKMKEMEQEAKEGRDWVEAERNRHLADLNHRLQDVINASAADRARLEQEMKELQDRATTAVTIPSNPTPYVQVLFCLATHEADVPESQEFERVPRSEV